MLHELIIVCITLCHPSISFSILFEVIYDTSGS